jgi:uncharacterized membrane protein YphA (DoxX/SURF4 family)
MRHVRIAPTLFALGLAAIGALSVIYRDFAFEWQPVPPFPGRAAAAVACGLALLLSSLALLFRGTGVVASRLLLPILLAWLCLKIPAVVTAPLIEGVWIGFGEVGMLLGGGLALFATLSELQDTRFLQELTGPQGMRIAQIVFGLAVIPVGLGHIFYVDITASLVPSWLPFRYELAYLTGIAQITCGLALIIGVAPRAAALVEASMVGLFAFLVWGPNSWFATVPKLAGVPPGLRFPLTAFLITWAVGAAALLIADAGVDGSALPANHSDFKPPLAPTT